MSTEKRKLTRAERKQIEVAIARANQTDKKQLSAQDSIPYQRIFPDGICRVTDTFYTKTVQYQDINYQLSQNEDKTAIFEGWCDFLNYFDSSIKFQLSFLNLTASRDSYANSINIPPQGDEFDSIRAEYTEMLQNQLAKGNNGLIKTKYLTFGIEAASLKAAKPRLERIETDVMNNFKRLGVVVEPLNGKERLRVLHQIFHMDGQEPFQFSWDWLAPSGLSTKDFIAPSSFSFPNSKTFCMGKKFGAVSFVQILAPELNDRMLADFLDMESSLIVNLHIQSVDQVSAIKTIKRKITDLDRAKIEEQKKAVRSGYDMDIIPSDLATYGTEAKKLLQDLQSRNERMFLLTFLVLNTADSQRQLANNVFQASSIAQKHNCQLTRLDFQQEEGLMSSLPLGYNQIEIQRGLTTSSVAIFVPFTTQELFQDGKEALYYGLNALSNNLIMVDRKLLKNPNGLILGTPGSGKSFSAKREISNVFLVTNDDVLICDPEDEYAPLVIRLGGQVVKISPTSSQYVNPMDINLNYSDDDNPLALKADFILSLCDIVVGSKDGLQPVEKTVIDRAVRNVYRPYLADPDPEKMPILQDLYDELLRQPEPEAKRVAAALELYVTGSLNVFNHRTNVELTNRLVCFNIKELGKQLKQLGMLVIQDQVWNRVTVNRAAGKTTRYYCDEFHLLLKGELASWSVEIWKRFRKWGGIPTGITQNIKDLLASREIENIFENSDFIYMLNQASGDRQILAKQLNLLKYFPEQIEKHKGFIKGLEADMGTLAAHPHPADSFAGMEVRGDTLTDKENAGAALLDACKEVKNAEPVQVGSYRGFAMSVSFDAFRQEYTLQLKGQMTHQATLGADPRGNLTRIDNALAQMPQRLESVKAQLDNLYQQQAAAKEEVGRPFPYEDELREKSARLTELDTLLNIDSKAPGQQETIVAKSTRPSVLEGLRCPMPPRAADKKSKTHEEVR